MRPRSTRAGSLLFARKIAGGTEYSHLKSRRQKPSKTFQAGGRTILSCFGPICVLCEAKHDSPKGAKDKVEEGGASEERFSGKWPRRELRATDGRTDGSFRQGKRLSPPSPPLRASPFRNYFRGFNPSLFKTGLPLLEDGWWIKRLSALILFG